MCLMSNILLYFYPNVVIKLKITEIQNEFYTSFLNFEYLPMKYRNTFSCLFLITTAILFIYWLKGHTAPQIFGEAIFSVKTQKKVVALTFDEGPTYPNTNKILDILYSLTNFDELNLTIKEIFHELFLEALFFQSKFRFYF